MRMNISLGRLQPTYELNGRNAISWCPLLVAAVSFVGQSQCSHNEQCLSVRPRYSTISLRHFYAIYTQSFLVLKGFHCTKVDNFGL